MTDCRWLMWYHWKADWKAETMGGYAKIFFGHYVLITMVHTELPKVHQRSYFL